MMRIMQPANRGLACRIPCCPVVWWQSGLFSALAVNVRVAHESSSSRMRVIYHNSSAMKQRPHPQSVAEISYKHAIQPCNTHLHCIVVTSWHCVLHHKLAIKTDVCLVCCVVLSSPSPSFFKSLVYQRDTSLPQQVSISVYIQYHSSESVL